MTTLYGIKNCDTVKNARKWLDSHGVPYTFSDFRADGLDADSLRNWVKAVGWEILLNRRGLSWRKLPEAQREGIDEARAISLMENNPTLIKRPVVEHGKVVQVGFKEAEYEVLFKV